MKTLRFWRFGRLVLKRAPGYGTVVCFIAPGAKAGDVVDVAGTPMRVIRFVNRHGTDRAVLRHLPWYEKLGVRAARWFAREIARYKKALTKGT